MNIPTEKVHHAIEALHAAEQALMECGPMSNGALAAKCLVAAIELESSLKISGEPVRVVHLTGEQS